MQQALRKRPWVALALFALVIVALPWLADHWQAAGGFLTASMYIPVMPKSPQQLAAATAPSNVMVVRAPWYDTQAYVSGTTTRLSFFNAINSDKTLSNTRGNGGTFPAGTWFEPLWCNIDYLATNVLGGNTTTGKLDDLDRLFMSGRGILNITVGQTTLPPIPISYCHASGGPIGSIAGTWTAPQQAQFGNNGTQDSGYSIANSWTIGPNTPFGCTLEWTAAQTLVSTTPFLRVSFDGNWYLPMSG